MMPRPFVGWQASENNGSGIALHVCVGQAAWQQSQQNKEIQQLMSQQGKKENQHAQHWDGYGHLPLQNAQHPEFVFSVGL